MKDNLDEKTIDLEDWIEENKKCQGQKNKDEQIELAPLFSEIAKKES